PDKVFDRVWVAAIIRSISEDPDGQVNLHPLCSALNAVRLRMRG
ncbi:unnamed protein product, partial [marine sediment metagenome]